MPLRSKRYQLNKSRSTKSRRKAQIFTKGAPRSHLWRKRQVYLRRAKRETSWRYRAVVSHEHETHRWSKALINEDMTRGDLFRAMSCQRLWIRTKLGRISIAYSQNKEKLYKMEWLRQTRQCSSSSRLYKIAKVWSQGGRNTFLNHPTQETISTNCHGNRMDWCTMILCLPICSPISVSNHDWVNKTSFYNTRKPR